jgi:hypothetical protein
MWLTLTSYTYVYVNVLDKLKGNGVINVNLKSNVIERGVNKLKISKDFKLGYRYVTK